MKIINKKVSEGPRPRVNIHTHTNCQGSTTTVEYVLPKKLKKRIEELEHLRMTDKKMEELKLKEIFTDMIYGTRQESILYMLEYKKEHGALPDQNYKINLLLDLIERELSTSKEPGLVYLREALKKLPKKYSKDLHYFVAVMCLDQGSEHENVKKLLGEFETRINNYVHSEVIILKDGGALKHNMKNIGKGLGRIKDGLKAGKASLGKGLKAGQAKIKDGLKTGRSKLDALKLKFKRPRLPK